MKPVLLKTEKVDSHALLGLIQGVLQSHPSDFFFWPTPGSGAGEAETGATAGAGAGTAWESFDYEEWDNLDPMRKLHLERADAAHVSVGVADGGVLEGTDADNHDAITLAFSRLFDLTQTTHAEAIGRLEFVPA